MVEATSSRLHPARLERAKSFGAAQVIGHDGHRVVDLRHMAPALHFQRGGVVN